MRWIRRPERVILGYLYKLLLIVAACSSAVVLYFSSGFLLALSVNAYPAGALLLLPWMFGVCGAVGLLWALQARRAKSPLQLRMHFTLLCVSLAGALIFTAVTFAFTWSAGMLRGPGLLIYCLFPLLPLILAITEMYKLRFAMRAQAPTDRAALRNFAAILLAAMLGLVTLRVLTQEAVMAWYGHDLVADAHASADTLARGAPYCVVARNGATRFEELDKRAVLLDAVQKRAGFPGFIPVGKDPHFGIVVNGMVYWWSFQLREFRALPGRGDVAWPGRACDK